MPTVDEYTEQARLYALAAGTSSAGLAAAVTVVENNKQTVVNLSNQVAGSVQTVSDFNTLAQTAATQAVASASASTFAVLQRAFQIDNRNTYVAVAPGSNWNGTAGSGYTSTPTDPTRTTAKPPIQPLVAPLQTFTDYMVVGVIAGANYNGQLLGTLGLDRVRVYYEGNTVDILQPSFYSFLDVNGVARSYFGWWAVLLHDGRNMANASTGGTDVYYEAIPKDTTMQSRVIGPYRYYPRASLYDVQLTIEPSQPVIAGQRYQTLAAATEYIRTSSARFPLITIRESGTYDWTSAITTVLPWGYCTVQASVPVTIGKPALNTAGTNFDTDNFMRPRISPVHLKGSNITLDLKNLQYFMFRDSASNPETWLNGVNLTNTDSAGRAQLWRKLTRNLSQTILGKPYFTECNISNIHVPCYQCSLARGNTLKMVCNDLFTESDCVVYNTVDDADSTLDWNIYRPAFTVQYLGSGATATLEMSGNNLGTTRTFTLRVDGTVVSTYTITNSATSFSTGGNYHVAQVVAWINGLGADWTATVIDDSIGAAACQADGTIGPFGPISVKGSALTIYTYFDLHSDFYQKNRTGVMKYNVIIVGNLAVNLVTQNLFFSGDGGQGDFLVFNNCFDNKSRASGSGRDDYIASQLCYAQSHVVIAHNSFSRQSISIRSDIAGTSSDIYTLVANNVVRAIVWPDTYYGGPDLTIPNLAIVDNHIFTGFDIPSLSTGTTVGGDGTSLFANSIKGDFTPLGALVSASNLKPAKVRRAIDGRPRSPLDCAGAI